MSFLCCLGPSPNKPPVCEFLFPGLLWEGQGIQTRAGGCGKETSWDLEHPPCCTHPWPPIQAPLCGRGDVRRMCLAGRVSWLPVASYSWWPCWHPFCVSKDGQISAAWRALVLMVALLCLNIYVLTWEAAGQGRCDRTSPATGAGYSIFCLKQGFLFLGHQL